MTDANVTVSVESEVILFHIDTEGKEVPLNGRENSN